MAVVTPTTWNPSDKGSGCTLSDGDLKAAANANYSVRSVFGASSGKWYWEVKFTSGSYAIVGVGSAAAPINSDPAYPGSNANSWGIFKYDGNKYHSAVDAAYASAFAVNDTVGVALDMDAGTIAFYQGGTTPGVAYSGLTGTIYAMFGGSWTGGDDEVLANFGASAFAYTPPTGFQAGFGELLTTYALSGVTRNASGDPAARTVRAFREDTGAFVGTAVSDGTTGAYSITTLTGTPHTLVAYPAGGESLPALVLRGVVPIES